MPNHKQELLWENRRTKETRKIEAALTRQFDRVEAYRFNSASIRVRVIDARFEEKSIAEREDMVLPLIRELPKKARDDITLLLTLAPIELEGRNRRLLVNLEFEHPHPAML